MVDPVISWVLSLCLAAYWGSAAVSKLRDPQRFMLTVSAYRLLPAAAAHVVAVSLPFFELFLAITWILPPARDVAAYGSAALLVLFVFAIAINLARGRSHIDCGCHMKKKQGISWWLVLCNSVMAMLCLALLLPVTDRALSVADVLVIMLITAFTCMTSLLLPMIISNMNNLTRGIRQ